MNQRKLKNGNVRLVAVVFAIGDRMRLLVLFGLFPSRLFCCFNQLTAYV